MMRQMIFLLLLCSLTAQSQAKYEQQLLSALEVYDNATDFKGVLGAAEQAQILSDKYPDEWLPSYWTSFLYSQAGRLSQEKLVYYDIADQYLSKTASNISESNDDQQVYYHALSSLIATLSMGPNFAKGDIEAGTALVKKQEESLARGLAIQSDSPLLQVLLGTNTITEGFRAKPSPDISKLVMGKALLEQAKQSFSGTKSNNPLTPDRWNEGWIEVWLSRLKNS